MTNIVLLRIYSHYKDTGAPDGGTRISINVMKIFKSFYSIIKFMQSIWTNFQTNGNFFFKLIHLLMQFLRYSIFADSSAHASGEIALMSHPAWLHDNSIPAVEDKDETTLPTGHNGEYLTLCDDDWTYLSQKIETSLSLMHWKNDFFKRYILQWFYVFMLLLW